MQKEMEDYDSDDDLNLHLDEEDTVPEEEYFPSSSPDTPSVIKFNNRSYM